MILRLPATELQHAVTEVLDLSQEGIVIAIGKRPQGDDAVVAVNLKLRECDSTLIGILSSLLESILYQYDTKTGQTGAAADNQGWHIQANPEDSTNLVAVAAGCGPRCAGTGRKTTG